MKDFSHNMYVTLRRESSALADKYLEECWLRQKEEETPSTIIETPKEDITQAKAEENIPEKTFSRTELEAMLKNAGIKFSHLSKDETLVQKCIENNLL